MKNLKKVLALVLVVAMMASFAVSASAKDFTDSKTITQQEAVDVMTAIGVIDGYADGSFKPEGTLTREQAAKMITYMLLGKSEADKLVAVVAPYTDVAANRWSAGAIAYCANEGIIAGVGNGKFNPTGELTGLQFAKMLLVALGYDPAVEKLTGSTWAVNTAKLALNADLDDDIDATLSTAISRQNAAQMAFNTLKADLVEYDTKGTTVEINGATIATGASKAEAVADKENKKGTIKEDEILQFAEKYQKDLKKVMNTKSNDFGAPGAEWKFKNSSVGTYADTADASYTGKVTLATIYDLLGKSMVDDLKDGNGTLTIYTDGDSNKVEVNKNAIDSYAKKGSSAAAFGSGNGTVVDVYIDDYNNDDYDEAIVVVKNQYLMKASSDYNKNTEKLNVSVKTGTVKSGETPLKAEDWAIADYSKDDYILYTVANGEIQSIEAAKVVSGKVESYKSGDNVVLDGTTYKYNVKAYENSDEHSKSVAYEIKETAKVVLDNQGYIIYVDETSTTSDDVVFVDKAANSGFDRIAKIVDVEGKSSTVTVDTDDSSSKITDGDFDAANKGFYSYKVDGSKYELTEYAHAGKIVVNQDAEKAVNVISNKAVLGTVTYGNKTAAVTANAKTVYIVKDEDGDYNVYTGVKNAPTITIAKGNDSVSVPVYVTMNKDNNKALYVYVDVKAAGNKVTMDESTSSSSDKIYVLKVDTTKSVDSNDNEYYTVTALVNGEVKTYNTTKADTMAVGELYKSVTTNSNGYVTSAKVAAAATNSDYAVIAAATSVAYSDGVVTIADTGYILANNDVKAYLVLTGKADNAILNDANASYELVETDADGLKSAVDGYTLNKATARLVLNDDGEVTAIYMNVSKATEN